MFRYLKFWWQSSNQHGIHSPFVYTYLTKGIYESPNEDLPKQLLWLHKSIRYFNPTAIYVMDNETKEVLGTFKHLFVTDIKKAGLIIGNRNKTSQNSIEDICLNMNKEQLLLFYQKEYNSGFQQKLRNQQAITLVLDFYYGSLISNRKEQLKQNFFLRM